MAAWIIFSIHGAGFRLEIAPRIIRVQHSICATMCDIFITNDERFADKFKAVAYYLDIPIQIIKWQDINI